MLLLPVDERRKRKESREAECARPWISCSFPTPSPTSRIYSHTLFVPAPSLPHLHISPTPPPPPNTSASPPPLPLTSAPVGKLTSHVTGRSLARGEVKERLCWCPGAAAAPVPEDWSQCGEDRGAGDGGGGFSAVRLCAYVFQQRRSTWLHFSSRRPPPTN